MKEKFINAHMQCAITYSKLSHCKRLQVGSVIVKNNSIIAIGYNGTPKHFDNKCEDNDNVTLPCVIHAEDNALRKLMVSNESAEGASIFVTQLPCEQCAIKIADAKITDVYFLEYYRSKDGILIFEKNNIKVTKLELPF
jgi:dCMP deaminase